MYNKNKNISWNIFDNIIERTVNFEHNFIVLGVVSY